MTAKRPKCQVQGCTCTMERSNTIMCHKHYQLLTGGLKAHIAAAREQCRKANIRHSDALQLAQQNALRWARDEEKRRSLKLAATT